MNLAAKKILLAVGTVVLAGAVGLAQTTGGARSSSKTKKKHSTPASTSSTQSDQNASSPSTAEASTPTSTTSSANPALPQSDSSNSRGSECGMWIADCGLGDRPGWVPALGPSGQSGRVAQPGFGAGKPGRSAPSRGTRCAAARGGGSRAA